jgi:hypothetical protein
MRDLSVIIRGHWAARLANPGLIIQLFWKFLKKIGFACPVDGKKVV